MGIVAGVNARFNLHVKANEHGSGARPIILFAPAGTAAGQEETMLADVQTRLQALCDGKVISASLNPRFGYGALASYNTFNPDDLPEANQNRTAEVVLVDASGSIIQKVVVPYIKPTVDEAAVAAFFTSDLGAVVGRKLRLGPQSAADVVRVAQVQFRSRM